MVEGEARQSSGYANRLHHKGDAVTGADNSHTKQIHPISVQDINS